MASVIYLTDTRFGQRAWDHPSARHRCYHYADALRFLGHHTAVMPLERITAGLLRQFDHVIFHRPTDSRRFRHALKCCKKSAIKMHADYDDLVFDPHSASGSPMVINRNRALKHVEKQFQKTQHAAGQFSRFITSTSYLKFRIERLFPTAVTSVVPNALPRLFRTPVHLERGNAPLTIGYFPGSNGHNEDFRSVLPALQQVVREDTRLLISGRMDSNVSAGIKNVVHLPFADYKQYLKVLSCVDVSIAPLVENEFNQSKSAVKLIESTAVGTPVIASANADMQAHSNTLSTLVPDNGNWLEALSSQLVKTREKLLANRESAKSIVSDFSVMNRVQILEQHLQCDP